MKRSSAARKTAGIKGKRITAKQRVARVKNIAVARSHRKNTKKAWEKFAKAARKEGATVTNSKNEIGGFLKLSTLTKKLYNKWWDKSGAY